MSDLVSVVRSLPEALGNTVREPDGVVYQSGHRCDQVTILDAASLLAGLFAECPNCEDGIVDYDFERDERGLQIGSQEREVPCPSCRGGVVIKPDIIVRMATEIPTVHSTPADCEYWYDRCHCNQIIAERALWAVFGGEQ